jgi:hypothetical protein
MAVGRGKSDAGQGGRRGHSNMAHWMFSEEHKEFARKARRLEAKQAVRNGIDDHTGVAPRALRKRSSPKGGKKR